MTDTPENHTIRLLQEMRAEMRKGFAEGRPAHVPDAPTHASLVAAGPDSPHHLVLPAQEQARDAAA